MKAAIFFKTEFNMIELTLMHNALQLHEAFFYYVSQWIFKK